MPVSHYMDLCLNDPGDGYYAVRPKLGEDGDFITAPLVSQMFGELLGLWAVQCWRGLGGPRRFVLAEMGPGDGALMRDALRAARLAPDFLAAAQVRLVETSAPLRALQVHALADVSLDIAWTDRLQALPEGPLILIGNECLDCLPIRQAVRTAGGWRERLVGLDSGDRLGFVPGPPLEGAAWPGAIGEVREWSPALEALGGEIGARIAAQTGAAVFIDYGRDQPGPGDTLQALRGHVRRSPFDHPGEADLTAHVDFPAFLAAASAAGANVERPLAQGEFLLSLGLAARAAALCQAHPERADVIGRQVRRLVDSRAMGRLFKVACIHAGGPRPAGWEGA